MTISLSFRIKLAQLTNKCNDEDVEFLSLGAIFQECDIRELRPGEPLFYQGSQGDGYWVVRHDAKH